MFDLKNIDFIKNDELRKGRNGNNYSFVGLKKSDNPESERLEFWLPLGFDTFEETFEKSKNFFFKMYRTFQVYRERKLNQLTEEERTTDRDGVFEFENGFSFVNDNNEQVVFYGKLNALDKILEGYDELRISSLEKKQVRSNEIDYSNIHKYMHQAIYLDDDVIYLDEMNIAKNVLIQDSPPIIQLFSFIYTEIKEELKEFDTVPDKAYELADRFKESYLQPDSSLFAENTFGDTINILKNVFEEIDSKTTYKDEDFWHFFDAIEAFLFGERIEDNAGVYFGINNFYDIWEDMCQNYMLSNLDYLPKVLFADLKGNLATRRDLGLSPNISMNPFLMKINTHPHERFLRPDLVISNIQLKDIFTCNKLRYPKNNQDAFGVFLLKPYNFPDEYEPIKIAYKKYLTEEKNKKKIGDIFKYMLRNDFLEFEKIVKEVIFSVLNDVKIIDYKYMRESDYQRYTPTAFTINENGEKENKIKEDIHKQLIYEWAIQQNFINSQTESEFWIPYYSNDLCFETSIQEAETNEYFAASQIKVIKINFQILQETYIQPVNNRL